MSDKKRINVAVSPETVAALQAIISREGVTVTEAVRRLIGYGDTIYRAVTEDDARILLETHVETREMVIL